MPIPNNLHLTKLPFAIFFGAQDFGDKITLSTRLRDAAMGLLDGESLILPVPANGPPDLPRVQLQSRDSEYVLQLSTIRLAFEWTPRTPGPKCWEHHSAPYIDALGGLLRVFAGEYARPGRFAFTPQFLLQLNRSANDYISTQLIQPGRVARRPYSARISLTDQLDFEGLQVALTLNLATARQQDKPERDHALVLHFEIQSGKPAGQGFSGEEIMGILSRTSELMEERIRELLCDLYPDEIGED